MSERRFAGKAGQEYDLWIDMIPHYKPMKHLVGKELARTFENTSPDFYPNVLEFGCGTGYTTKCILDAHPRIHLTVVDNEPVMLNQARKNLHEYVQSNRICFVEKDILTYLQGRTDSLFQGVASSMTLHNFDTRYRTEVLKLLYKALDHEGVFINADKYALDDPVAHQASLDHQIAQFKDSYTRHGRQDLIQEWVEHHLRDNEPDLLMKQQEAIDEMKQIGFKDIQIIFREQMEAILVARK